MQITTLHFPFRLHAGDIRAFRAALVECVGLEHSIFHGHDNSNPEQPNYTNEYPLVRFGVRKGYPVVTGVAQGAEALIRYLLPAVPRQLIIAGKPYSTDGYRLRTRHYEVTLKEEIQVFGLYRWIPLNKNNYDDWKALEGKESARQMLLNRCLTGHLRAMAENLAPDIDRNQVEGQVLKVDAVKRVRWHGNDFVAFNVVASANYAPPYGLGLGRCHSFGFGEIYSERSYYALLGAPKKQIASGSNE